MILVVSAQLLKRIGKNSEHCSLFLLCLLFLSACQPIGQRQMFVLSGPIMGTDYRISLIGDSQEAANIAHEQVLLVMNSINQSMSTYLINSEISQINRADAGEQVTLSDPLFEVLKVALTVSELSGGAFDVTVGPLVDLWGFGAPGVISSQPTNEQIQNVADFVGYQNLSLQNNQLRKQYKQTQINLSAIAKGYTVDLVAQTLNKQGFTDYLINIGGEIRAAGVNIDRQVWRVGIEKPNLPGGIQKIIKLNNAAIATSGDYLNFLLIDGQRYSHTIDPTTSKPVLHRLALVSVIHENAMMADALATAMMAMGEEKAWAFAQEQNQAVYLTIRDENGVGVKNLYTTEFLNYFDD